MRCKPLSALIALALAACGGNEPATEVDRESMGLGAATATPSAAAGPVEAADWGKFHAGGNEPFWAVDTATPGQFSYSTPELIDGVSLPATVSAQGGWTRFEASLNGAQLVLEVRKTPCTDSMSGFAFSHEARLTRPDGTWDGCARLDSEPQPTE